MRQAGAEKDHSPYDQSLDQAAGVEGTIILRQSQKPTSPPRPEPGGRVRGGRCYGWIR